MTRVNRWTTEKKATILALSLSEKTAELLISIPEEKLGARQLLEESIYARFNEGNGRYKNMHLDWPAPLKKKLIQVSPI